MALVDDIMKSNAAFGLAVGAGLAVVAPFVLPIVGGAARPILKALIKTALVAYESGREQAAELAEFGEDLVAEVRAELEQEHAQHAAAQAAAAAAVSAAAAGSAVSGPVTSPARSPGASGA